MTTSAKGDCAGLGIAGLGTASLGNAALRTALMVFVLGWIACDKQVISRGDPNRHMTTLRGDTMGTSYRVSFISDSPLDDASRQSIKDEIEIVLREVNAQMSTYLKDSEISRFNAHSSIKPFPISPEFQRVVSSALLLSKESGGAFDPTILPLVELFGFGALGKPDHPPSDEELERARNLIGFENVEIEDGSLIKTRPEVCLDLAGIAKGFGVDIVFETLDSTGVREMMVEIGGEVRARGLNREGEPWRIGIETPTIASLQRSIEIVLRIEDSSVATSGDYRNYRVFEGKRVSHTFDPRTGSPITHRLASVTVIARTCLDADGLATAANVLGPEEGLLFLEARKGVEGYLLVRSDSEDEGFEVLETTGFRRFVDSSSPR